MLAPKQRVRLQRVLVVILAATALAIAARAALGSVSKLIGLRFIVNLQTVFALAALPFAIVRSGKAAVIDKERKSLLRSDFALIAALVALTLAAFAWTSRFYFLSDDFLLMTQASTSWRGLLPVFAKPGGDGFFRPIGYVFISICWKLFGADAAKWHWTGYAFHTLNCLLVYMLAGAIRYGIRARAVAAAVFALHGTRPEAVIWTAGRFDLLATTGVLMGLLLLLRACEPVQPWRPILFCGALCSMVLAMMTKESAFAFPLLAALLMARERDLRHRIRALFGVFAVSAAIFVYRWTLFGGIGGYPGPSGRPELLAVTPISVVKAFLRLWAVLFFPINWDVSSGGLLAGAVLVYAGAWIAALWTAPLLPKRWIQAVGFATLAAIPAISRLLIGTDLGGSRVYYLPSVGFCLLLGQLASRANCTAALAALAFLAFHTAALWHNLSAWEAASRAVRSACTAAAACASRTSGIVAVSGLPSTIDGVPAFANGFAACVAMNSGAAPARIRLNAPATAEASCRFSWDATSQTLQPRGP
jgi:hypothetical protein